MPLKCVENYHQRKDHAYYGGLGKLTSPELCGFAAVESFITPAFHWELVCALAPTELSK